MQTQTRLQHYHNEEETARCTDKALIPTTYIGKNRRIEGLAGECYYSANDDTWYFKVDDKVAERLDTEFSSRENYEPLKGEWFRVKSESLKGLVE